MLTKEQYELESSRLAKAQKTLGDELSEQWKRALELRGRLFASELAVFRAKKQHPANIAKTSELENEAIVIQEAYVPAAKTHQAKFLEYYANRAESQKLDEAWRAQAPRLTASGLAVLQKELLELREKSNQLQTELDAARAARNDALGNQHELAWKQSVQSLSAVKERVESYARDLAAQDVRDQESNRVWMQAVGEGYFWRTFGGRVSSVLPKATPAQAELVKLLHSYDDEYRIAVSKDEANFVALARLQARLDVELRRFLQEAGRNDLLDYRLAYYFHPGMMLEPSVQKRLSVSAEQVKQIRELCETWPRNVGEPNHAKAFNTLLVSDQRLYLARIRAKQTSRNKARDEAERQKKQAARQPQWRVWKSASGQFSVIAEILSFEHDIVSLKKKESGQVIHIPRLKLSAQDRNFLHERYVKEVVGYRHLISFDNYPLLDLLEMLNQYYGDYLVYDVEQLKGAGIDFGKRFTVNKEATFPEIFKELLSPLGLKFTATEGRIYVEPLH